MGEFTLTKSVSDVQEAPLLREDWYVMRIVEEPTMESNGALKEYMKGRGLSEPKTASQEDVTRFLAMAMEDDKAAEKIGLNLVLKLRVQSDDPASNGRLFRKYLPWPNEKDKTRYTNGGQSYEDFKLGQIKSVVAAFNGGVEPAGSSIVLEPGMEAQFYVTISLDQQSQKMRNELDMNQAPKAVL